MTWSSHNIRKELLWAVISCPKIQVLPPQAATVTLYLSGGSHFTKPSHITVRPIIRSSLFDAIVTQLSLTPLKAKVNSLCWHRKHSTWDRNLLFSVISIYVYMLPSANSTFCHCSTVDHIYLLWGFPAFCFLQIEESDSIHPVFSILGGPLWSP